MHAQIQKGTTFSLTINGTFHESRNRIREIEFRNLSLYEDYKKLIL